MITLLNDAHRLHSSDLTMTLPFMNTGDIFSNARKQFHLGIGPSAVGQYHSDYEEGSRRFMRQLADDLECRLRLWEEDAAE